MKYYDILIVGYGNIGKKLHQEYMALGPDIYDPYKGEDKKRYIKYDVAFIAVDTPMSEDGSCDLSQVKDAIDETDADLIVIRSTIPPGTTDMLCSSCNKNIVYSPEFYGMTQHGDNCKIDFNFTIIGHPMYAKGPAYKLVQVLQEVYNESHEFRIVEARVAELAKYMENAMLTTKVSLCVQFHDICRQLGISYEEVRESVLLDPRISRSHTFVYDDESYWDSHCFNKDLRAILSFSDAPLVKEIVKYNDACKSCSCQEWPMKNYSHNRKTCEKLAMKGALSEDLQKITSLNDEKAGQDVSLNDCLAPFADRSIVSTVALNSEQDLSEVDD